MLSSRTKEINAYGKRARRVVDATAAPTLTTPESHIISIFDDLPPAPEQTSLKNKMKKRENSVPSKAKPISVKVVGLQRKKRLSPVISPHKKKSIMREAQIIIPAGRNKNAVETNGLKGKHTEDAGNTDVTLTGTSGSPPRAPLSAVPLNIPGSPAISQGRFSNLAKKHLKPKSFSPFVDVDIIVLDDDGRTVRSEKRVNKDRANIKAFKEPRTSKPYSKSGLSATTLQDNDDSDYEPSGFVKPPKRRTTRKPIVISSDESDSEEHITSRVLKVGFNKETISSKTSIASSSKLSRASSMSIVEVLIPPAPYKLSRPPSSSDSYTYNEKIAAGIPQIVEQAEPQRYPAVASPNMKPRQLTPIRGSRKRLFEPPSPPSPTTTTDIDLSIDLSELNLNLGSIPQIQNYVEIPEYLLPLLEECGQEAYGPHNFSSFIESFPCDPILQCARESRGFDMKFKKIGEASYSEVFGIGDVVLKVIPLRDESKPEVTHSEEDGPAPSDAKDVRKEIIVTRAMGEVHGGFVKLLKSYVVRGRYPEILLQLWDEYNERKGSESVRPDSFKLSQVYAIIVLPNGGSDLEAYTFHCSSRNGWRQACSLFWQVAKSLAHAEHLVSFEHRDLHWGQILVKNVHTQNNALKSLNINQKAKPKAKADRLWMDDIAHGVQATVIDLGLSRMDAGDGDGGDHVHWTPFDDEVFLGEGDYQFDVYRMMKELTGGSWNKYHPVTNVLWLHYLLNKLIHGKGLKPPTTPRKQKASDPYIPTSTEGFFSEKDCYECLVDLENWLGKSFATLAEATRVHPVSAPKGKTKRKNCDLVKPLAYSGPGCAGEIVVYGVKREWIRSTRLY
ncbi:Serine/threonine-protein kinase haspin-like protein hrk1 [Psilocybe cubensis]|uniref:Serine/threonine-protein kinase haspin-like protein hrk1 n=2 Tax=Psilocybe cubensis TaxID=181762 RepID=A0ACB8H4X5_PSICU|nr:Serine/threonine-protein kinase haspin-like protein hrk1 [Psilocybe cubensis]KAH9482546.1 Serine/threonine-protein kinase haspin-like protein hrk1 [Psilocybe cubensis]